LNDEEHIHKCLVRWLINKRIEDRDGAHKFLYGHKGWNEKHPKSTLERDVRDQWAKGNRGDWGDWK
jgi:hypothetical protein